MAKTKTKTKTATTTEVSRSSEVREQILGIQEQKEKGYVNLVLLLYEAYTSKYAVEWGYKDFKTYSECELATRYRKAMNFVEIGEKVSSLGLPKSRLEKIGWSKLRILASILTKDNMEEWLSQAEEITYRELDEVVRKERVDRGDLDDRPKVVKLTIKMSEAEAGVIESAIDDAKILTNSENTTVALEMICSDWMETRGTTPGKANLDDHVAYLEKVYGCRLSLREEEEMIADDLTEESDVLDEVPEKEEEIMPEENIEVGPEKVEMPKEKKEKVKKARKPRSAKGTKKGITTEEMAKADKKDKRLPDERVVDVLENTEEAPAGDTEGSSTGDAELDALLGL